MSCHQSKPLNTFRRFLLSMESKATCSSTNKRLTNEKGSVSFLCPQCGDYMIHRSKSARMIVATYTCPKCGFEGPN